MISNVSLDWCLLTKILGWCHFLSAFSTLNNLFFDLLNATLNIREVLCVSVWFEVTAIRGWDCFPKVCRAINLFEKEDYVKKEDVLIAEGADFKNAMGAFDYTRPKVAYKATTKWNVDETIMKR